MGKSAAMPKAGLTAAAIERTIHIIRGQRVMLDVDLASLYGVETGALNRAVKRNLGRFPDDFMFQATAEELASLRSQSGISRSHGGRRYMPYAFTEHGVVMLSSVLNSKRAIAANIEIVRVFVRLRHAVAMSGELAKRLAVVEAKLDQHRAEIGKVAATTGKTLAEHERHIRLVFETIRQLMAEDIDGANPGRIGFQTK